MKLRHATLFAMAAALSINAATVMAQGSDSTRRVRSTTRIPVTKESPGEVTLPRVDTVMVYRTDTVTVYRTDTLTVTRVDTLRVEPTPPPVAVVPQVLRQIGGFYFGLAGGAALPTGDLDNGQTGSFHIDVPFGFDPIGSPIGVRFDAGYSRFDTQSQFESLASSPAIMHFGGDLKLRLPVLSQYASRFSVYGVGGASYNRFKDIVEVGDGGISIGDQIGVGGASPTVTDDSWHSKWGWNAGGGLQFGWGRTNLFVESRLIKFKNRVDINQVPLVLGLTWY